LNGEELLNLLRALADPTRLSIFDLLMQGTYCNCEIVDKLGLPANLVSHHLRALREAGLIEASRHPGDARWILYSIDKAYLTSARAALAVLLDPQRVGSRDPIACRLGSAVATADAPDSGDMGKRLSVQPQGSASR
jgi:ArsR family transcriptional regulator, arsenate/arsenite/antimonite-responsive transcriptional repressor